MTGHEPLLRMRRAGVRPACVWVTDDDSAQTRQMAGDWHEQPNDFTKKFHAHIRLNASDVPETMDFRCLVGLQVHMECSRGEGRARRLFDALTAARPQVVLAVQGDDVWTFNGVANG